MSARFAILLLRLITVGFGLHLRAETPQPITTAKALRELPKDQSARGLPVKIHGIVTYHEPARFLTFLTDGTDGVYISAWKSALRPGDEVEVEGVSYPGAITSYVADQPTEPGGGIPVQVLRHGPLPAAPLIAAADLADDKCYLQWIALHGEVRSVSLSEARSVLELSTDDGVIRCVIPGFLRAEALPAYLRGLPVTVSGVWGLERPQMPSSARCLFVPSTESIVIDPEKTATLFARPPQSYPRFFQPRLTEEDDRALFHGQTLAVIPGRGFFLSVLEPDHWNSSVWVQSTAAGDLRRGQWVKAVGRPELVERHAVLKDALFQPEAGVDPLEIPRWSSKEAFAPGSHGYLGEVEGDLLEAPTMPGQSSLLLQTTHGVIFARLLQHGGAERMPQWAPGSLLRVKGLCLNSPTPAIDAPPIENSVEFIVDDPRDITLVRSTPWWTFRRFLWTLAATATLAFGAVCWAAMLRRQVSAQTESIRQHLEKETRHEERIRISREWHDTLEQHLAGLSLQLQAAGAALPAAPARAQTLLDRACAITQYSRDEARRAIWDLRAPTAPGGLSGRLEQLCRDVAETSTVPVRCEADAGTRLDAATESHVYRVAQEALTNALKHGHATRIDVTLQTTPDGIRLSIRDNGGGFDPEAAFRSPSARFGLLGMRERADKINAELKIDAQPGAGATISLEIPRNAAS